MKLYTDNLGKVAVTVEEAYWSNKKDYDKLTIVEASGGEYKTYISRKPVPAGTPLTNRSYWIPFSSLREEIVLDFNTFINLWTNNLENARENLQTQITSNDNDIEKLNSDLLEKESLIYKTIVGLIVGGVTLKQEYSTGEDSDVFGISQKVLTESIGYVHKDDNNKFIPIQQQIDSIVGGNATTSLSITSSNTKTVNFVGTNIDVTVTASASEKAKIGIKKGAEDYVYVTGQKVFSKTFENIGETTEFTASFNINNIPKGTRTASVYFVLPISYGTYFNNTDTLTQVSTPKLNPYGDYTIAIPNNVSKIVWKVPNTMSIHKVMTIGAVSYEVTMENPIVDGEYLIYRSVDTFDAGTFKFNVS